MPDPAEGQLGHVFGVPFSTLPLPVFFDPIPRFSAGSGEDAVCVCRVKKLEFGTKRWWWPRCSCVACLFVCLLAYPL